MNVFSTVLKSQVGNWHRGKTIIYRFFVVEWKHKLFEKQGHWEHFARDNLPKGVHRDLLNVHVVTPLQAFRQLVKAHGVAGDLVDVPLAGEPSVAVHDEGHVLRNVAAFQNPEQKWIEPRISYPLLWNPRHLWLGQKNDSPIFPEPGIEQNVFWHIFNKRCFRLQTNASNGSLQLNRKKCNLSVSQSFFSAHFHLFLRQLRDQLTNQSFKMLHKWGKLRV